MDRPVGALRFRSPAAAALLAAVALAAPLAAGENRWTPVGLPGLVFHVAASPDGALYAGTFRDGVFKSSDGGETWEKVHDAAASVIAIDPVAPETVWLGTRAGELLRSDDGGDTWSLKRREPVAFLDLALTPAAPEIVYVSSIGAGILRSRDGGESWEIVRDARRARALAVDPEDPANVYAIVQDEGFLRSRDGGESWEIVRDDVEARLALALAIDPAAPRTIFAGTNVGVLRSDDGGDTWRAAGRGLPRGDVLALVVDPARPDHLYVSSSGRGVYRSFDGGGSWWPVPGGRPDPSFHGLALRADPGGEAAAPRLFAADRQLFRNDLVTRLGLRDGRFEVEVEWLEHRGGAGSGSVAPLLGASALKGAEPLRSRDSAVLELFDDGNWEILVKVLDGRPLNGRFWVFFAGATDVGYELTVTDTVCGAESVYTNPLGRAARAVTDVEALPGDCDDPRPPTCVEGAGVVCQGEEDRFAVRLVWTDHRGRTGVGRLAGVEEGRLARSDASGLFFFFEDRNWELLVKVLDGCAFNDRYWVFAAASTDVAYALTVRDTETGAVRTYSNPLGRRAPALTDTEAFDGCP